MDGVRSQGLVHDIAGLSPAAGILDARAGGGGQRREIPLAAKYDAAGLPAGREGFGPAYRFAIDSSYETGFETPAVGMTCAACHTAELRLKGKAVRIDGAPTLANYEAFMAEFVASLKATHDNDDKFAGSRQRCWARRTPRRARDLEVRLEGPHCLVREARQSSTTRERPTAKAGSTRQGTS
jgi:hypothetical protein